MLKKYIVWPEESNFHNYFFTISVYYFVFVGKTQVSMSTQHQKSRVLHSTSEYVGYVFVRTEKFFGPLHFIPQPSTLCNFLEQWNSIHWCYINGNNYIYCQQLWGHHQHHYPQASKRRNVFGFGKKKKKKKKLLTFRQISLLH